jgi:large subunit ribosomal protein L14
MIQQETRLTVADNSGAKEVLCIRVLGGTERNMPPSGQDCCTVKSAIPSGGIRRNGSKTVVVGQEGNQAADGSYIRFDDNAWYC